MKIEKVYDEETQKLIDHYNKQINEITEEYNNKMKSATTISYYEYHGGIEALKREYEARIKPYQDRLLDIYLISTPTYIITKEDDNI